MAASPAHKFGQIVGNLLEEIMLPRLQEFCSERDFYLDVQGERKGARKGRKVTWEDRFGNNHDLDFVIEKGATKKARGRPVAFIEAAWRRYTKHSRNKAQEIQGAVLPIAEKYAWDKPFLGVVLAGEFTQGSLDQFHSIGFKVLHFPYRSIIDAFDSVGIDAYFDESTPENIFTKRIATIKKLTDEQWATLKDHLIDNQKSLYDKFIAELEESLDRTINRVTLLTLYGNEHGFDTLTDTIAFLRDYDEEYGQGKFMRYELRIKFNNGDCIEASVQSKKEVMRFLEYIR